MYSTRTVLMLISSLLSASLVLGDNGPSDATLIAMRTTANPAPIVVPPSQHFEGNDGPWSTFDLRVGTPAQYVRVLVSTAAPETIVVLSSYGCSSDIFSHVTVPADCAVSRGMMFNASDSTTWYDQGNFALNHDGVGLEANLGYSQNMDFGLDTLGLGLVAGGNGPTLTNQTIAGIAYPSPFYLGTFGLNTEPVNFTNLGNSSTPSYLTTLKTQNIIPSLSWSYTAGAIYRLKQVHGQLILGGYDDSRFIDNPVSFTMADDTTRDLVVALQSISYSGFSQASLLDSPINIFIDSTDPFLWLPDNACEHFESAFGLSLDENTGLYLINDTHHSQLKKSGAEVTFHLSDVITGGASMTVTLPYGAFDLQAEPPLAGNLTSYYFPLKRAANESQYTLGRTFLQEAYLTADYERKRFNVSQCSWVEGAIQNIVPILSTEVDSGSNATSPSAAPSTSPSQGTTTSSGGISTGAIAGIVIGVVILILTLGGVAIFFLWRKRRTVSSTNEPPINVVSPPPAGVEELSESKWLEYHEMQKLEGTRQSPFSELGGDGSIHQLEAVTGASPLSELGGGRTVHSSDRNTRLGVMQTNSGVHELRGSDAVQVYELTGSDVRRAELDGSATLLPRRRNSAAQSSWGR